MVFAIMKLFAMRNFWCLGREEQAKLARILGALLTETLRKDRVTQRYARRENGAVGELTTHSEVAETHSEIF